MVIVIIAVALSTLILTVGCICKFFGLICRVNGSM